MQHKTGRKGTSPHPMHAMHLCRPRHRGRLSRRRSRQPGARLHTCCAQLCSLLAAWVITHPSLVAILLSCSSRASKTRQGECTIPAMIRRVNMSTAIPHSLGAPGGDGQDGNLVQLKVLSDAQWPPRFSLKVVANGGAGGYGQVSSLVLAPGSRLGAHVVDACAVSMAGTGSTEPTTTMAPLTPPH